PCVGVCPADAIDLSLGGVIEDLCYGCGRCLPICPQDLISTRSHVSSPNQIASLIESKKIDALEIHTQVGHYDNFKRVWTVLKPVVRNLKLLAISCTDGENTVNYLRSLYRLIEPLPCPLIWQTDGRSMSGDIGKGTTHAAIAFAQKVLQGNLPGYIQLAGGTNNHTVAKLIRLKMLQRQTKLNQTGAVSGVAYGSYARTILSPVLNQLETTELQNIYPNLIKSKTMNQLNRRSDRAFSYEEKTTSDLKLEQDRDLLTQAVAIASQLVNQIKQAGC
ncbi:MAG: LdpA C-terminal domain-containing domain, partial [Cyanobacteria bacterium P01_G01_bin.19]